MTKSGKKKEDKSTRKANVDDLVKWGFEKIGYFTYDSKEKVMAVTIHDSALHSLPNSGIYAFAMEQEVVRVGTSENDLVKRVNHRGEIVSGFIQRGCKYENGGVGKKEGLRWFERLSEVSKNGKLWKDGTVWARSGTPFPSSIGIDLSGELAEERYIIVNYNPYMNTGRN